MAKPSSAASCEQRFFEKRTRVGVGGAPDIARYPRVETLHPLEHGCPACEPHRSLEKNKYLQRLVQASINAAALLPFSAPASFLDFKDTHLLPEGSLLARDDRVQLTSSNHL